MDFKIEKRIIKVEKDLIVGDNADYVAHFAFDKEWDGVTKTARFIQNGNYVDVLLEDDKCNIPVEVLKRGYVSVGVYSVTMTTSQVDFVVKESIKEKQGNVAEPTPNVYEHLTGKLDEIQAKLPTEVQTYFNEHKDELKGDKGDKGDRGEQGIQGIQGEQGYSPVRGVDYWTAEDQTQVVNDVLASEEVTGAINTANEASEMAKNTFNSYANALKGAASGEVVRVDGVSPVEHTAKVKVYSKNIIPLPYKQFDDGITEETRNGITASVENGAIILNGTATVNMGITLLDKGQIRVKGIYTLSGITNGTEKTYYMQPYIDGVYQKPCTIQPVTYEWDGTLTRLVIYIKEGVVLDNVVIKPQLEQGDTATEYTPYVEPTSVTVTRCGKNLFNVDTYSTVIGNLDTHEVDGHSYTVKGAVGSATFAYSAGAITFRLPNKVKVKDKITVSLYVTLLEQGVYDNRVRVWGMSQDNNNEYGTAILEQGTRQKITCTYTSGVGTLTGIMLYVNNNKLLIEADTIQVELGEVAADYEAYKGETYTSSEDGTLEVTSIAPTMTLLADKDGVNIESEYNKDLNAVINDILSRLN